MLINKTSICNRRRRRRRKCYRFYGRFGGQMMLLDVTLSNVKKLFQKLIEIGFLSKITQYLRF